MTAPLAVEPGNLLFKARLLKCPHAGRDVVAAVLGPTLMIIVASRLDSCREILHEAGHCGIHLLVEALPVIPYPFLKMRELGNLADPS